MLLIIEKCSAKYQKGMYISSTFHALFPINLQRETTTLITLIFIVDVLERISMCVVSTNNMLAYIEK
jgi:hypothetical protein